PYVINAGPKPRQPKRPNESRRFIAMRHRSLFLFVALFCAPMVFAQRPPISAGVGNAVLLATNSIQIDRDSVVLSGDVIVNNAASGPVLGGPAPRPSTSPTTVSARSTKGPTAM